MIPATHDFTATFQQGLISQIDPATHHAKVILPALDDFETAWLPVLTAFSGGNKFYAMPDIDELVAVILDARGEYGYILGAIYNDIDTTPTSSPDMYIKQFKNGTQISHDRSSGNVLVKTSGTVTVQASHVVIVGDSITLNGATTINGTANIKGTLTTTGDIIGAGKSLSKHTHRGDSGGQTSAPQ